MFTLMDKEINAILGAQTVLIWTYVRVHASISKKYGLFTLCLDLQSIQPFSFVYNGFMVSVDLDDVII